MAADIRRSVDYVAQYTSPAELRGADLRNASKIGAFAVAGVADGQPRLQIAFPELSGAVLLAIETSGGRRYAQFYPTSRTEIQSRAGTLTLPLARRVADIPLTAPAWIGTTYVTNHNGGVLAAVRYDGAQIGVMAAHPVTGRLESVVFQAAPEAARSAANGAANSGGLPWGWIALGAGIVGLGAVLLRK